MTTGASGSLTVTLNSQVSLFPDASVATDVTVVVPIGKSVPEAAYQVLRDANRSMHAKELVQRLVEGGLHIKGKTPLTSVATSLKRDKRFRKVGPNTFEATEEVLSHAV